MSMRLDAGRRTFLGLGLLASGALSLAGCSSPSQQAAEQRQAGDGQRSPDAEAVLAARWAAMFADPAAVIAAANEFGYAASPWSRAGSGSYQSLGIEQRLPAGSSPPIVRTGFKATGAGQGRVDAITFTFAVDRSRPPESKKARDATNIPRRVVGGFLSRFGLSPNDAVRSAVQNGTSTTMQVKGGGIVVKSEPVGAVGSYRTTVTIAPR